MLERIVIVGAGQGGLQAAISLRQDGFAGSITLIGAEDGLPYQRPPLSKAYLKSGDAEALRLRPAAFYDTADIALVTGVWIDRIDRLARMVHAGGQAWPYDHLILASGTRNLRPPIPGLARALDLRTLDDAVRLRGALDSPKRCAVIGGGFIGLEFAAVAAGLGHDVTVAEAAPRLMARVLSPQMSDRFAALHRGLGTELHLDALVTEVTDDGILLRDGTAIAADIVLLAAGVVPNDSLARDAGLDVANGVVVDAQLRTSDSAISALGDCAVFPDPVTQRPVRLESVQAATDHARLIARRLVGGADDAYAAVPWFWSDQADAKLQIAGLATPQDDAVTGPDGSVWRFAGNRLSAVETVNAARTHMQARKRMALGPVDKAALIAADFDLTAV
ncbi:3-phenylpropionate/trans-cinnamate dioxygenase ferredoxin reductase subunit [Loktanella fryxellensis]|uniref:3-phenylpropionate/trans-cinnamate dioxygenase ferredoxin reductase subunit n=1 Tax=Loktanella fryxellensis TaxID=245187 RepID=A0A1H8HBY1_9RHOB|nr:FAD-dependent oxidoreductase [Loktanella fryxellensis]SEN53733.1 3-phenylpropionate/trans-cinnamate dioxygenase ferredoxin reductase subunit [Loktanella fryxellensis]